jgi:hypothetical protein
MTQPPLGPEYVDAGPPPIGKVSTTQEVTQPARRGFHDELETRVSDASHDVLRSSADATLSDDLDAQFRSVYEEFIETKQRCGESTDGVTYDKFALKLKANLDQLMSRYACRTVRFQVYVKDGKAALKATPVSG